MIYHHDQGQKILADTQSPSPAQNRTRLANTVRHIFFFYFGRVSIATLVLTTIIVNYQLPGQTIDILLRSIAGVTGATILFCRIAQTQQSLAHLVVLLWARYGIYRGYAQ